MGSLEQKLMVEPPFVILLPSGPGGKEAEFDVSGLLAAVVLLFTLV